MQTPTKSTSRSLRLIAVFAALAVAVLLRPSISSAASTSLRTATRVVFVGDSITGQGALNTNGWVQLIDAALTEVSPTAHPKLVPLGGSGQSVESWQSVEKDSRDADRFLDVPKVNVKAELDQKADILVVMLGMNNILAPYTSSSAESLDRWEKAYGDLIASLASRAKPDTIALGTITPCTEDPASPRNKLRALMNERIVHLARANGYVVLPTGDESLWMLQRGRTYSPEFHVTRDWVHPNFAGHVAIALGMLNGLGDTDAAAKVRDKYEPGLLTAAAPKLPALSWSVAPGLETPAGTSYRVHYWWRDESPAKASPRVTMTPPTGWKATPLAMSATQGEFTLTGSADKLRNVFTLSASSPVGNCQVDGAIPAPWRVATGVLNIAAWPSHKYEPQAGPLPWDEGLAKGEGLGALQTAADGRSLRWTRIYPSADFTGGPNPASIDFVAASAAETFEAGYAARWIYSAKERSVSLKLGSNVFAGNIGLAVWLNGERKYAAVITSEPQKQATIAANLHQGWNFLLAKSNHFTWQWQVSIDIVGVTGDDLTDVRYATSDDKPKDSPK
ncbi:MAG TPA: GDSL-type esterase/lipase family protein [Capsulimonadaceae bacterium]